MRKSIIFLFILLFVIIGAGGYLGYRIYNANKDRTTSTSAQAEEENPEEVVEEDKTINIFNGDERPVAVMIDNHEDAWAQSGLNEAYMVYEIIVEGSETRLMALFKGKDVDVIGPVRSSRHYFLDYALENDAIYGHIGWSPQAEEDIDSLGVNNINGLIYDSGEERTEDAIYWRSSNRYAPHNCYTSISGLVKQAAELGYRTTSSKKSVLNYVKDEIDLGETATVANSVYIPFSSIQDVKFVYDPTTKRYTRYARDVLQTDASTDEALTTKNIIIEFAYNYTLDDDENKGRQGLENIDTLDGYYITNGKAIKITCEKTSRAEQTVYKDEAGNEINVNDGNTYVEICPTHTEVSFE
ncbi:MAG: DUF3048 domain-containing protein [Clostridia bacterium]|nr:DUF3048 domain-containing protein [Clostridia bacterium]